jgi:hypothetical protein
MQLSLKEFRHLAQGTQSIATTAAIVAAVALACYAIRTYRETQAVRVEASGE